MLNCKTSSTFESENLWHIVPNPTETIYSQSANINVQKCSIILYFEGTVRFGFTLEGEKL